MTIPDQNALRESVEKSAEEIIIKISVKQIWISVVLLISGTSFAVMLYANIMASQQAIMASQQAIMTEVRNNAIVRDYKIESVNKDLEKHEVRIAKLESK